MDTQFCLEVLRDRLLSRPDTEEYLCYHTPAMRVKKKMIVRLREDGETLVLHADDRDIWLKAEPGMFYVTDHYYKYPLVLVRLDTVTEEVLAKAINEAWQQLAPEKTKQKWKPL